MTNVLFVCTANRCRSPIAAALLREHAARAGLPVAVTSAGLLEPGQAPIDGAVSALDRLGIDLRDHRSRSLDASLVEPADLVLGMERAHVREAVLLAPSAWPRTFTVKEIVRRAQRTGPRGAGEPMARWLERVGAGRRRADLLGSSRDDDIEDPTGGPPEGYEITADELDAMLGALVGLAWPETIGIARRPS